MDRILSALLNSEQTEQMKRQLVSKIAGASPNTEDEESIQAMFKTSTEFILNSKDGLSADLCKKVYKKWASYHKTSLANFFNPEYVQFLMDGKFQHEANTVWLLHETFLLLRGLESFPLLTKIVEAKTVQFIRGHPQDEVIAAFCKFLFEFKECIPRGEITTTFCMAIVHTVSAFSAPTDNPLRMPQFLHNVTNTIGIFLRHIWTNSGTECIMNCLKAIFSLIAYLDTSGSEPCIALGGLVTHIPLELIEKVVKSTVADPTIADANMVAALLRVIDWLNWPLAVNIDHWILAFLDELASAHKYTILIQVTENKIQQVYEKLHYGAIRERGMAVLSHMLLSFQHSPEAFHKVVDFVPQTVKLIQAEGGPETAAFLDRFSELMHCLMTLHPGFPDLYDKVVDALKDYRKPSAESIRLRLTQSKWSAQNKALASYGFSSRFAKKSETGKTGLVNLGNTCYMNSVIQALYMCDSFRRDVLQSAITPHQILLLKFQHLFAHLAMTQRAAYSPAAFLKASRPAWFAPGHQQDCSEFLKYVLDQLHEQERTLSRETQKTGAGAGSSSPKRTKALQEATLIQRTFGGQLSTTYQCLTCKNASTLKEPFTDLPLAFPSLDNKGNKGGDGKSVLIGGSSEGTVSGGRHVNGLSNNTLHLGDMLDYYLKPELLQNDNRYQCETCGGLQNAERSIHITQAPEYLIFTLLRFAYNIKTQSRSKIFTDVRCPRTLRIPVSSDVPQTPQTPPGGKSTFYVTPSTVKMETYSLCSVVVHSGTSSECGHYYCYARPSVPRNHADSMEPHNDFHEDHLEDKWFLFNDSRVTYSSYNSFSNVTQKFAKDTVYIPIYKRIPEAIPQAPLKEPPLRKDLRESVERDNKFYLQEQELEARARAMQKASSNVAAASSWYGGWKDDDGNGPPGSCGGGGGGGGLGHIDTSGSRFIF